jgi:uncharacterized protein
LRLLPRKPQFYDLLDQQADNVVAICQRLSDIVQDFRDIETKQAAVKDLEHQSDQLTQDLYRSMLSTFITPLDKDDMAALAGGLDDVVDYVDAATARFVLYQIERPTEESKELAALLLTTAKRLSQSVHGLRDLRQREGIVEALREIHESDAVYRRALGTLFNTPGIDPIYLLKWKEIYERVEMAVDKCEDVSDVIEGIILKYA